MGLFNMIDIEYDAFIKSIDDNDSYLNSVSFDILDSNILKNLDTKHMEDPRYITYMFSKKEWNVFTDNTWHKLSENAAMSVIKSLYSNKHTITQDRYLSI